MPGSGLRAALKRTVSEFREDNVTTWAAALTYYGVLSVFPALLVFVSILGLVGPETTQPLLNQITGLAAGGGGELLTDAMTGLQSNESAAGLALVIGTAGALWSASGYIGAFIQAANAIWDVEEGRPFWKTIPLRLGLTVVILALLLIGAFAVVLTGGIAEAVGNLLGLGATAVTIWEVAKWPVLVLLVAGIFSLLYYATPNVRQPGFPWVSPGGIVAVLLWLLASGAFALYVANFGSYDKTYGSLGGVISFLVWLWISNIAVLFGAELNAELERGRQIAAGQPADQEPFLPPRDVAEQDAVGPEPTKASG